MKVTKRNKTCEGCKKERDIMAEGLCSACYLRSSLIKKRIAGSKIEVHIPYGDTKKANDFYLNEKEAILVDLQNNPRKWLDQVK